MGFQLSFLKSYKMMLLKYCTQYVSKFGKLSKGNRTEKGQLSFQSQRRAMSLMLISHDSKLMLKILQARLQQYMSQECPYVQPEFRNGKETRQR